MRELVQFLNARFDEDERLAEAAKGNYLFSGAGIVPGSGQMVVIPMEVARHIACQAPERVLAEVEAKRRLLELHTYEPREPETEAELHARFAHPAYEYETTEGPRKMWDYADVPPYDDNGEPDHTWEPNTDAGDNGWARLDYTEEAYWRRRLPAGQERKPYVPEELKLLALPYAGHPDYQQEWRP